MELLRFHLILIITVLIILIFDVITLILYENSIDESTFFQKSIDNAQYYLQSWGILDKSMLALCAKQIIQLNIMSMETQS
jgi:hypothetical protein